MRKIDDNNWFSADLSRLDSKEAADVLSFVVPNSPNFGCFIGTKWDNRTIKGGGYMYSWESVQAIHDAAEAALQMLADMQASQIAVK